MGLRFRKLLRIARPLAFTVSGAGVGVRVGVAGMNVSFGPSGAAVNTGLPGTGVGYRIPLGPAGVPRDAYRAYRAAVRAEEAARRADALAADEALHAEASAHLDALDNILAQRLRGTFDLHEVLRGGSDAHDTVPFVAELYTPDGASVEAAARREIPSTGLEALPFATVAIAAILWLYTAGTDALVLWANDRPGMHRVWGVTFVVAVLGGVFIKVVRQRRRRAFVERTIDTERAAHDLSMFEQREAHERAERARIEEGRVQLDAARAILRQQLETGDAGPLGELFEVMVGGFDWPVPVVADVVFEGVERAEIELVLPEIDDIPGEVTSLTARGKLSRKAMRKSETVRRYEDLCCGLALRLMYDTFRFLGSIQRVQVRGMASRVDAMGHDEPFLALFLDLDRATFESFDLDRVDPSTAVSTLGRWGGDRRGMLGPVVEPTSERSTVG